MSLFTREEAWRLYYYWLGRIGRRYGPWRGGDVYGKSLWPAEVISDAKQLPGRKEKKTNA